MGTITYTIPVAGSTLNSVADPEIATALQTLLTLVNGQLDTNNLSPTANIAASQLKTVFPSGLLAARPAAASAGQTFYYATDAGLLYWSNGTAWTTVASPAAAGAWQTLTLGTNILSLGNYTPSARIAVDRVELKGAIQSTATISNGVALFTVPSSCKPASQVILNTLEFRGGLGVTLPYPLAVDPTTGAGTARSTGDSSFANGAALSLDGISYSLS